MSASSAAFWIALAAAVLGGWCSTLNIALREMSRSRLRAVAERRGALRRVERILDDPAGHAAAVSAPRVVLNLLLVLASVVWLTGVGDGALLSWVSLLQAGLFALALLYVLGVVVPTSLASHAGERIVYACAPLLRALRVALAPFIHTSGAVDVAIRRLIGVSRERGQQEIEREIKHVVTEGEEEGALNETERDLIEAVVDLRRRTVQDVMTPRTEIEGLQATDNLAEIQGFIESAGHSRIPVYEGDLDHIVGVLYAKDLLRYVGRDASDFRLKAALREPLFVPDTIALMDLLTLLQQKKVHMALVLDEYGGTAGLATIEDVIEELVGEIHDEYEPDDEGEPEARVDLDQAAAVVDARMHIHDANETLEAIHVTLPDASEYETVGGFVIASLGRIPAAGEAFRMNGFVVTVLEAEPTRVMRVRVERWEGEEDDTSEGEVVELPMPEPAPPSEQPAPSQSSEQRGPEQTGRSP